MDINKLMIGDSVYCKPKTNDEYIAEKVKMAIGEPPESVMYTFTKNQFSQV